MHFVVVVVVVVFISITQRPCREDEETRAQKDEAPRPAYKGQEKIQSGIHLTPKLFPTCHLTFSPLRKTFAK